jgi:hypothetical protein
MPSELKPTQCANAEVGHPFKFLAAGIGGDDGGGAQAFRFAPERVEHDRIVGAVGMCLDHHAARHAQRVEHFQQIFQGRVVRRVRAFFGKGKLGHRSEDVEMGVAGAGGRGDFRRAGGGDRWQAGQVHGFSFLSWLGRGRGMVVQAPPGLNAEASL